MICIQYLHVDWLCLIDWLEVCRCQVNIYIEVFFMFASWLCSFYISGLSHNCWHCGWSSETDIVFWAILRLALFCSSNKYWQLTLYALFSQGFKQLFTFSFSNFLLRPFLCPFSSNVYYELQIIFFDAMWTLRFYRAVWQVRGWQ